MQASSSRQMTTEWADSPSIKVGQLKLKTFCWRKLHASMGICHLSFSTCIVVAHGGSMEAAVTGRLASTMSQQSLVAAGVLVDIVLHMQLLLLISPTLQKQPTFTEEAFMRLLLHAQRLMVATFAIYQQA